MTLRSIPFTLALAGLLASAPAQNVDTGVQLSLWLDVEPGRLEATRAMISALLKQPAQCDVLTQATGIEVLAIHHGSAEFHASSDGKPLGVVECRATVTTTAHPTPQQLKLLHDQLALFVGSTIRAVTEDRPRRELMRQIDEEQHRWQEATAKLAEHAPGPDLAARATMLQQQRQNLATQLAEARLVFAVESKVRDRLRAQQAVQQKERDELEARRRQRQDQLIVLQSKLVELRLRSEEAAAASATAQGGEAAERQRLAANQRFQDLRSELASMEREVAAVQHLAENATRAVDECTRAATFALEQLPTTELLLLRTEVRLQALAEQSEQLKAEELDLRDRSAKAARDASAVDLLRIDQQVARDRLTELKGKLARIEPLRIEVLSGR